MCFGQNLLASFFPLCWWGQVFFRFTWSDYLACFCYVLLKCPVWHYQGNVGDPNCTLGEQESGLSCHFASLLFPVAHHNPSLTKCSQNMVTGDNRCSKETILCSLAMPRCSGRPAPSGASWLRAAARTRLQGGGGRGRKERRREKYFLNSMNGLEQGREHMMGKGMKHSMWAEWRQHLKHILRHKTLESLLAQLLFTWRKPVASLLVCAGGSGGWWVRGSGRHSEPILQIFNFWSFELFHWIFGMFWHCM